MGVDMAGSERSVYIFALDPAVKRERTTVGKAGPDVKTFTIVPAMVEVVPLQMVRPSSNSKRKPVVPKHKLIIEEYSESEDDKF
ncbi:hypothetical protein F511_06846 [Dorcoceras hygrometricum]|uniref:Uncharacterized protein n=1 Tax=Dorcoceras hygrometricum TaxID=472368 RepID=A0A2Z7BSF9_9LAMI|nr:hypothetical protein F511_06846 [Dorcoceras hygrometricum]